MHRLSRLHRDDYGQHEEEVTVEGSIEARGPERAVTKVAFDGAHLPLTGCPDTA
jgi:hypothetical protein